VPWLFVICAPLRVSSAPAWNRLNYLVDARHPGCSLGRPGGQNLHSGLFKVWPLDLVVRSRILAVSGAAWVDLAVCAGRPFTDKSQSALSRCRALESARLPGGVEPVGECGVAAACSGGADRLGQRAAGSGQDDELPGAVTPV